MRPRPAFAITAIIGTLIALVVVLALPSLGMGALVQGAKSRNERLTGTSKVDRILAGRGDDVVFARDRRADYVNCGPGKDRAILDQIDRAVGCEIRRYPPTSALVWPPFLVPAKMIHPAVYAGPPASVTPLAPAVPRPKPPPKVIPPEKVPSGGAVFGLVANSDAGRAIEAAATLGAPILRVEFEIGDPASAVQAVIEQARSRGIEILPQAGYGGRIPTDAEARNVGAWAQALDGTVRWIEFGNETGFSYHGTQNQGAAYGRAAGIALEAMKGSGVGLLVQADDGNTGSGWIAKLDAGDEDLDTGAAGWTIHPYGPRSKWEPRLQKAEDQLAAAGVPATARLFVTEWGISTDDGASVSPDNYGWPTNLTYCAAGADIGADVPAMLARFPRIKLLTLFQAFDQTPPGDGGREHYFGALRNDLSPKPCLTPVVEQLGARYRG